jgi:hypothetical protein
MGVNAVPVGLRADPDAALVSFGATRSAAIFPPDFPAHHLGLDCIQNLPKAVG